MPTVARVDRAAGGGRPFDTGPAAAGAVAYCAAHGWEVAIEFVEPCASGIDERRPELQRLLDMALTKAPPSMLRQVFALFEEYQSKENAKHMLLAMRKNARQGFWNGSKAPYGYAVVAAEQRGAKTKKRVAIDPVEAEVARLMFRLFREGDGTSGPIGVKAVVSWLNAHCYRTRTGPSHFAARSPACRRSPVCVLTHGLVGALVGPHKRVGLIHVKPKPVRLSRKV
jgi:hypothetical protein